MGNCYLFTWDDALDAWVYVWQDTFLASVMRACGPRAELVYQFRVFELDADEIDRVARNAFVLPPDLLAAANAAREASR